MAQYVERERVELAVLVCSEVDWLGIPQYGGREYCGAC